jgi:hypothetical protein
MSQLFSPFSPEFRDELQKVCSIYDIETGKLMDSVDGSLCLGVAPVGCPCNACRFMCGPPVRQTTTCLTSVGRRKPASEHCLFVLTPLLQMVVVRAPVDHP